MRRRKVKPLTPYQRRVRKRLMHDTPAHFTGTLTELDRRVALDLAVATVKYSGESGTPAWMQDKVVEIAKGYLAFLRGR